MGIPLYAPGERIRRLGEACEITKRLFTQQLTDFDGRYYQPKEARLEPKPVQKPHPPFVIGGAGEQLTLRVVARYADVELHARRRGDLQTQARRPARPLRQGGPRPKEIELSVQAAGQLRRPGGDGRDAPAARRGRRHAHHPDADPYPDGIVARLADEVVGRIG